jgi:hypothetical protein
VGLQVPEGHEASLQSVLHVVITKEDLETQSAEALIQVLPLASQLLDIYTGNRTGKGALLC